MAIFESNRKLELPRIRIRGDKVLFTDGTPSAQVRRTTQVYDRTFTKNKISKEKNLHYKNPDLVIRNESILTFKDRVTIDMTTPNTSLKDYRKQKKAFKVDGDKINLGELNPTSGKGEIRYTLNGKDPCRTKYKIFQDEFKIKKGTIGAEKVVLKARLFTRGRWSDITSVEFRIISNFTSMSDGLVIDNSQA